MNKYITQAYTYLANAVKFLDDSKDPFEAGDLIEVREAVEYKDVAKETIANLTDKYAKRKGEKVAEWRMRIIPRYNEIKKAHYSTQSKFYTTKRINTFIKEIEEYESKYPQFTDNNTVIETPQRINGEYTCEKCGLNFKYSSYYERHINRRYPCVK